VIRRGATVAVLVATLAACGADDDDDEQATKAHPCDAAQAVADLDDEFQGEVNEVMQSLLQAPSQEAADAALADLAARLERIDMAPLLDAYADLESSLEGEPSEAAGTLRTFTERFVEQLRTAESSEEIVAMLEDMGSDEEAQAAGQAALDLDEWSRETCDVVIAD